MKRWDVRFGIGIMEFMRCELSIIYKGKVIKYMIESCGNGIIEYDELEFIIHSGQVF